MSQPVAKIVKCYVGTFLLRRAHYFSEAGHQSPSDAKQEHVVVSRAENMVLVRG